MNEFELIHRFFSRPTRERAGVGDDCALIDAGDTTLAVTTDMLLAGRHFRADADPGSIGHKALAVNLSDLAAAGATPRCFFLALALPVADEAWLAAFSRGLLGLADTFGCELVGGDTTRTPLIEARGGPRIEPRHGPLTICITAIGEVPRAHIRTRAGAQPGDDLWVSGELGDAALALSGHAAGDAPGRAAGALVGPLVGPLAGPQRRLDWPQPRVELGVRLRGLATAAIDVSDGLLGDIGHVLERSGVGARIDWTAVPLSPELRGQPVPVQQDCALAGGDDYELAFAAPPAARAAVERAGHASGTAVTRIGSITQAPGLAVLDASGTKVETTRHAYDHFAR